MAQYVTLNEHSSDKYSPRTYANAKRADVTIALAVDHSTAGEKCTRKAAGDKYIGYDLSDPIEAARGLYKALRGVQNPVVNVAGNGIYTLEKHRVTQREANLFVYTMFHKLIQYRPITMIVSGGQTGIDHAGLVAAEALAISANGLFPNGFIRRTADGVDMPCSPYEIAVQIMVDADLVRKDFKNGEMVL